MRRARGFTLAELLVSLALIGMLAGIVAGVARSLHRDDRMAAAYATDLAHVRTASDALATAVRAARSVDFRGAPSSVEIDGETWAVENSVLRRSGEPVSQGISRLHVVANAAGLVTVGVAPVPRRDGARAPSLVRTVRRRVSGETARGAR